MVLVWPSSHIVMGSISFAVARLLVADERDTSLILVTTGRKKHAEREWRREKLDGQSRRVSVPFYLSEKSGKHRFREPSFRSRTFVFGVMAGIAAHLAGSKRIIIPESGQGALGPSLVPVGLEASDVRAHPSFTKILETLLQAALGSEVRFEHPRLWFTKGETLQELVTRERSECWERTHSCARSRHVRLNGRRVHCGVCSACLMRRQSVLAAGLRSNNEVYRWSNSVGRFTQGCCCTRR